MARHRYRAAAKNCLTFAALAPSKRIICLAERVDNPTTVEALSNRDCSLATRRTGARSLARTTVGPSVSRGDRIPRHDELLLRAGKGTLIRELRKDTRGSARKIDPADEEATDHATLRTTRLPDARQNGGIGSFIGKPAHAREHHPTPPSYQLSHCKPYLPRGTIRARRLGSCARVHRANTRAPIYSRCFAAVRERERERYGERHEALGLSRSLETTKLTSHARFGAECARAFSFARRAG